MNMHQSSTPEPQFLVHALCKQHIRASTFCALPVVMPAGLAPPPCIEDGVAALLKAGTASHTQMVQSSEPASAKVVQESRNDLKLGWVKDGEPLLTS